jgi:FAD/FMN-containing dehydrogenase
MFATLTAPMPDLQPGAEGRMLRLHRRRRQLELQAGTSWASLAAYLSEHEGGPHATRLAGAFAGSIGGAVSRNDAGPDGVPIAVHVEAIALVLADGEVRRADRQTNAALLRLAIGGHGLIGVLSSVTLRVDSLLRAAAHAESPIALDLAPPAAAGAELRRAEFLVPPAELDPLLAQFQELAAEHRVALHGVAVRRLQPETETVLRWASREWAGVQLRFSMRATLGACVHATEIERKFLDCVLRAGGSFPLAASRLATLAQFETRYPSLREFLAAKRRLDPADRLQSAWYRRLSSMLRSDGPAAQPGAAGAE